MDCPPSRRKTVYRHTAAYVGLHARRRPLQTAVLRNGVAISFATLHHDLLAMTQALRGLGLVAGQVAAIGHDDLYVQLLLVFGFESLGVVTGSFRPGEGAECNGLLAAADIVMLPRQDTPSTCRRLFLITDAWVNAVLAPPVAPPTPLPPAAAPMFLPPAAVAMFVPPVAAPMFVPPVAAAGLVLFRSSGTTGQPKLMLLTYGMMEPRLTRQREAKLGLGLSARSRFLAVLHFSVGSMVMSAINCFRLGATFMYNTTDTLAEALVKDQPTHLTLLPFQLRALLSALTQNGTGPLLPHLTVQTIGGVVPDDLRRRMLQTLAPRLQENYGSNEVGGIGTVGAHGELTLQAELEVQVASPSGAKLPAGEIGLLRVRSPSVIDGYVNDPQATAAMFRDGWFYPGDLAQFIAHDCLRLVGRRSDVLNLGGRKVACAELESRILARLAVLRDVAVLQRNDGTAVPVTVCVVADTRLDLPLLAASVTPIIGFAFHLQTVTHIPRNAAGKIKRLALHEALFGSAPVAAEEAPGSA